MCVTLGVPAVKFGVHELLSCADGESPARRYREWVEEAVFAEAVGFESVWPVEQHFHPQVSLLSCPTLILAAIAERTHRLRLGTAIVQLSLDHPLRVSEEIICWFNFGGLVPPKQVLSSMLLFAMEVMPAFD